MFRPGPPPSRVPNLSLGGLNGASSRAERRMGWAAAGLLAVAGVLRALPWAPGGALAAGLSALALLLLAVHTDAYGYARTRPVAWRGVAAHALTGVPVALAFALRSAPLDTSGVHAALLGTLGVLLGAFLVAFATAKLKLFLGGARLTVRLLLGALPGAALGAVMPALTPWPFVALLLAPLGAALARRLKRRAGVDPLDWDTDFNPLLVR
ncbi:hypothetical protein [Deinococcus maricopensis]|uniref:Uncharacterized protein n=1 Tax=Deinococcus maricopensis (strain DSM 21211 / LMG 22137 / NRRL B-23946 / LB-34) TaxID=709986 RepID=E8UC24_DEIML|nr:hypothetical protein [Deinococcus maricopensis]ADV68685.1 hypothetical protein Deima_3056 [Deinococcus maricopensis DSM 21211]